MFPRLELALTYTLATGVCLWVVYRIATNLFL